jgi:flagellar basal-body rod protein FlgB
VDVGLLRSPRKWRCAKILRVPLVRSVDFKQLIVWPTGCMSSSAVLQPITGQLERYMDLLSARQKLVASNVANADTPGYRTQDIDFQSEFLNATGGAPHATAVTDLPVKNDGNNVSLDREARLLAENALRFQVASQLMKMNISIVRSAIQGGTQ